MERDSPGHRITWIAVDRVTEAKTAQASEGTMIISSSAGRLLQIGERHCAGAGGNQRSKRWIVPGSRSR